MNANSLCIAFHYAIIDQDVCRGLYTERFMLLSLPCLFSYLSYFFAVLLSLHLFTLQCFFITFLFHVYGRSYALLECVYI